MAELMSYETKQVEDHEARTVRDAEGPGSNPGIPTIEGAGQPGFGPLLLLFKPTPLAHPSLGRRYADGVKTGLRGPLLH